MAGKQDKFGMLNPKVAERLARAGLKATGKTYDVYIYQMHLRIIEETSVELDSAVNVVMKGSTHEK